MTEQLLYHEHLMRLAAGHPDKPALVDRQGALSYAELAEAMGRVGRGLERLGVGPGDRVAMAIAPSTAYAALILGTWMRGAVAVPVNTRLSAAEIDAFLAPIEPTVLICDAAHRATAAATGRDLLTLESHAADAGLATRLEPIWGAPAGAAPVAEEQPALIIGTGGTTGVPKGAFIDHRRLVLWCASTLWNEIRTRRDTELFFSGFFHISIITGWMSTLFSAGTVHLLDRFDVERALEEIDRGITYMMGAATMFAALRRHPDFARIDRSRVRQITWGAMASSEQFARDLMNDYPNARLANSYAATEFGPVTRILHEDFLAGRTRGIGRPQPGAQVRIVDDAGAELPPGEVGEIAVRCPWQMCGYWGKEEETRRTWQASGVRLGDVGWRAADGWLHMSGRKKEMIVSGGENVFPAEVETVLARHPDVLELVVYGAPDDYWGERVEAAVVARPGARVAHDELVAFGRDGLAGYKLPKRTRLLAEIPLTSNHKPDRRRLSADATREQPQDEAAGTV